VLKRLVSGGRREEIFATKAELLKRISHLPPELRTLFDPLALGATLGGAPSVSASAPAPAGADPATLVMARRGSAPDARSAEPPRPASPPSDPVIVSRQVEIGAAEETAEPNGQLDAEWTRGD
jgi:hypothetical protein